jgi:hypothetical protein
LANPLKLGVTVAGTSQGDVGAAGRQISAKSPPPRFKRRENSADAERGVVRQRESKRVWRSVAGVWIVESSFFAD